MPTKNTKRSRRPSWRSRLRSPYLIVPVLLVILLVGLEATNTTHLFHKQKVITGTIPSTAVQTAPPASQSASQSTTNGSIKADNSSSGTPNSSSSPTISGTLIAPSGTFVSNHHPGKNGAPYTEESTCNTTPGANCYIKLTMGSDSKTLATQSTNSDGSTSWNWNVQQAGLTSGSWQVMAVATAGSQTKTTTDPIALEVP